mgnify:FL=1
MRWILGISLVFYSCSSQQSEDALINKVKSSLTDDQKDIVRGGKAFVTYIAQVEGKIRDPKMIDRILVAAAEGNLAYSPDLAKPDTVGWRVEKKGDTTFVVFYARAQNIPTKKVYEASWRWSIDKTGRWIRFKGKQPEIRELSE